MKIKSKISDQIKNKIDKPIEFEKYDGNENCIISTGSTLLDLAISGTRVYGGGIPTGIAVEISGPPSAGKTVILCELAGAIQRFGGDVNFKDTEHRLDKEFAKLFDFEIREGELETPDTVQEIFDCFDNKKAENSKLFAIIADSVAAASTEDELKNSKGYDGAQRAKDFSIGFRRFKNFIAKNNCLFIFSNQVRSKIGAPAFARQTEATGGWAPKFYTSLRLDINRIGKLYDEKTIYGKKHKNYYGIVSKVTVEKSSIDKSTWRSAEVYIDWNYGIDDIQGNLVYLKQNSKHGMYSLDGETKLGKSLEEAKKYIEDNNLEKELKDQVIKLWNKIQKKFQRERKKKVR